MARIHVLPPFPRPPHVYPTLARSRGSDALPQLTRPESRTKISYPITRLTEFDDHIPRSTAAIFSPEPSYSYFPPARKHVFVINNRIDKPEFDNSVLFPSSFCPIPFYPPYLPASRPEHAHPASLRRWRAQIDNTRQCTHCDTHPRRAQSHQSHHQRNRGAPNGPDAEGAPEDPRWRMGFLRDRS